jgi:hypothetical protein
MRKIHNISLFLSPALTLKYVRNFPQCLFTHLFIYDLLKTLALNRMAQQKHSKLLTRRCLVCYPDRGFSYFSSVYPGKFWDSTFPNNLLPNLLYFSCTNNCII